MYLWRRMDRSMGNGSGTGLILPAMCPVLVVKDEATPFRRITLATDGSDASAQALRSGLAYRPSSKGRTPRLTGGH
jgi:hypothetical protein